VLMVMDRVPPDVGALVQHYFSSDVDRILIAVGDAGAAAPDLPASALGRVHVFELKDAVRSRDAALRRLLHRYGEGHWCVLVDSDELLLYPHADVLSLKGLCSYLDAAGFEALDCHVVTGPRRDGLPAGGCDEGVDAGAIPAHHGANHERLRTLVSDPIRGRVFAASICVEKSGAGIAELKCCSRVALLKYRSGVLIGRELRAVCGERVADLEGVVVRDGESSGAQMPTATARCGRGEPAPADTGARAASGSRRQVPATRVDELAKLGLVRSTPALDAFVRTTLDARVAH
jgi:hypothetical protein